MFPIIFQRIFKSQVASVGPVRRNRSLISTCLAKLTGAICALEAL